MRNRQGPKYLRIRETISVVSETDVLRRARTIPLKLQAVHRISLTYLLTHSPPHVLHLTPPQLATIFPFERNDT